jgi:hypothetical protein
MMNLMGGSEKISMGRKGGYELEFYGSREYDLASFVEGKNFSLSFIF